MIDGLYYEEHGPADGPPLILSAGLGGSGAYWRPNLPALSRGHRAILYDHRGTGRSDRSMPASPTIDDMADDLRKLIEGLGLSGAAIVGHALGGAIGIALALREPRMVRGLAVVNGWARLDPHTKRCFELRLDLLRDSGTRAYLRAQPLFLYPAAWISEHLHELDVELESQLAQFQGTETLRSRIAALQAFDVDDRLGDIRVPVLALAARDDMLVPYTRSLALAERIDGATVRLMDSGGHACNVTEPDAFNQILLAWLAGVPSEGAS